MHKNNFWDLKEPIDTFFFDCDGTLSLIEGINVLATMNGVADQVHQITQRCMSKTGMSIDDYRQRLNYVQPTIKQLDELAEYYTLHMSPGAYALIQLLRSFNKKIYIISAGIKTAVDLFAQTLGIPSTNVLAVEVYFDAQGRYQGFDEKNNMAQSKGKTVEIATTLKPNERSILVGDGITDWEACATVTRFIGYAGINPKEWVKNHYDFYINYPNFSSIIPLGLTPQELQSLPSAYHAYYEQGLADIYDSLVLIKEDRHVHYSGS